MNLLLKLQALAELTESAWTSVSDGVVETDGDGHIRIFVWPGAPEREQSLWMTPLQASKLILSA